MKEEKQSEYGAIFIGLAIFLGVFLLSSWLMGST